MECGQGNAYPSAQAASDPLSRPACLALEPRDGTLHINGSVICAAGLSVHDIGAVVPLRRPRIAGWSVDCTIDLPQRWISYNVESMALHFTRGRCRGATVSLLPIPTDAGKEAAGLLIAAHLRMALPGAGCSTSKTQVEFAAPWGKVLCRLDFQLGAASVIVDYDLAWRG